MCDTCTGENGKYLGSIIGNSVSTFDKTIGVEKTTPIKTTPIKTTLKGFDEKKVIYIFLTFLLTTTVCKR